MLILCLAVAIAAVGTFVSTTGGTAVGARARVVFHLCVIAFLSLGLAFTGHFVEGLAPWLTGAWFTGLAVVYASHALGVRLWGSPMNRAVLLFSLGKFPHFARMHPRMSIAACPGLAVVFGAGWAAAQFDVPADSMARIAVYIVGASISLGCAAVLWRSAHISARSDLVLGLILGGDGPMPGPPPDDPSLGRRRQHRATVAPRRATVVLFVIDSLRTRNMSRVWIPAADDSLPRFTASRTWRTGGSTRGLKQPIGGRYVQLEKRMRGRKI
jgi:hypothetical protein